MSYICELIDNLNSCHSRSLWFNR